MLLDEYDTPLHSAYLSNPPCHGQVADFMKIFIGAAFKDNEYLQKGLITGILQMGLMDLFSGPNSVPLPSMTSRKYAGFFGFTEDETIAFVKSHSTHLNEQQLAERLAGIKDWYNGYEIGGVLLYNPWSILQCLDNDGVLDPYWHASGEDSLLGQSLRTSRFNVKNTLVKLVQGEAVEVPVNPRSLFADLEKNADASRMHIIMHWDVTSAIPESH